MMRRPARAASRGFTVIEFVIASALTLALITTVSVATSSLQRSMAKNRLKAEVAVAAANIFEQSRAFNCGAAVNPSPPSDPSLDSTARIASVCKDRLFSATTDARGDVDWQFRAISTDTLIEGKFSTTWRQSSVGAESCLETANASAGELLQPSLLVRRVDFSWNIFGTEQVATYEDVESYPSLRDIYDEGLGGVVVRVPQTASNSNSFVTLLKVGDQTSSSIKRRALPCKPTIPGQPASISSTSVWFPYLPYGEYTVTLSGTASAQTIVISKLTPLIQVGLGGA